ncbi:hypothetical protein D3C71_1247240 [compost metagenome]
MKQGKRAEAAILVTMQLQGIVADSGVMSEYDASDIGRIDWQPSRWELLLARPVKSWSVEDWSYAVVRTDDCHESRTKAMDLLRKEYPELGTQFRHVLEVWEAGYGPEGSKPSAG